MWIWRQNKHSLFISVTYNSQSSGRSTLKPLKPETTHLGCTDPIRCSVLTCIGSVSPHLLTGCIFYVDVYFSQFRFKILYFGSTMARNVYWSEFLLYRYPTFTVTFILKIVIKQISCLCILLEGYFLTLTHGYWCQPPKSGQSGSTW